MMKKEKPDMQPMEKEGNLKDFSSVKNLMKLKKPEFENSI
jgi:hypothetical protein